MIKRLNRTLKVMLSKLVEKKGKNWDELLDFVLMKYHTISHYSTGESPVFFYMVEI